MRARANAGADEGRACTSQDGDLPVAYTDEKNIGKRLQHKRMAAARLSPFMVKNERSLFLLDYYYGRDVV
jgi:hypothetical protein